MVQQVLSAPGWHQYEAKLKRKDGTIIVANISLRSFLRYGAQEPSIEAFVEDTTELRASEESMRQALTEKELYQNAIEALEQAVLITEPDGKIREINRAFSIIYGYERDEVVGRNPHILNPGKSTYLELGYSEEEYDNLFKVGISDSILRAERALTSEVFEEMKKHTTLGYNTVKGKKEFAMVSAIILHHHERWDGSGYPMAIAGEDVPLSARITALADVYDALRSERPYKRPWSHERAVQEIVSSSGTHF